MIKRKGCPNCNEKIKNNHNFCSSCGTKIKEPSQDWGMLGKNDTHTNISPPKLFGGISGGIMNKMLGSAMKMLEKEMKKEMGPNNQNSPSKIRLMINGKEITPKQKIIEKDSPDTKFLPVEFNTNSLKKWKTLDKKEPKSNLKRIEDKIKYEIEIPEVESIKDISIIKLENSLEIRAIGKKEAYLKTISIDLPLKKYSLLNGILTLEMDAAN